MAVALEDFDDDLNGRTLDLLGDTITYTPSGGAAQSFKAIVDYGDNVEQLSGSKVIQGECAIEVPIATIAQPSGTDVIALPKRPGQTFNPRNFMRDESGQNWLIVLSRVPQ